MTEIRVGDGWRLLRQDEEVWSKDEIWNIFSKDWEPAGDYIGCNACNCHAVRRRIIGLPKPMEIRTEDGLVALNMYSHGPVWIKQYWNQETHKLRFDSTKDIRQLVSWLQQVIEWRDSQGSE